VGTFKEDFMKKSLFIGMTVLLAVSLIFMACPPDGGDGGNSDPTVTSVEINPTTANVARGTTKLFIATVIGTNTPPNTVTWSITTENLNAGTTIVDGLLSIATEEANDSLTVKATSTFDESKSITAVVTVTAAGTPPPDPNAPVYKSVAINAAKTIITLTFDKAVVNALTDIESLKAAVSFAVDGKTFVALDTSDTVATSGATLIVTFDIPQTGNANKIKVAAGALQDAAGNKTAEITTAAINALDVWSYKLVLTGDGANISGTSFDAVAANLAFFVGTTEKVVLHNELTKTNLISTTGLKAATSLTDADYGKYLYAVEYAGDLVSRSGVSTALTGTTADETVLVELMRAPTKPPVLTAVELNEATLSGSVKLSKDTTAADLVTLIGTIKKANKFVLINTASTGTLTNGVGTVTITATIDPTIPKFAIPVEAITASELGTSLALSDWENDPTELIGKIGKKIVDQSGGKAGDVSKQEIIASVDDKGKLTVVITLKALKAPTINELNWIEPDGTSVELNASDPTIKIKALLDSMKLEEVIEGMSETSIVYKNGNAETYTVGVGVITWTGTFTFVEESGYGTPIAAIASSSLRSLAETIKDYIIDSESPRTNMVKSVVASVNASGKLVVAITLDMVNGPLTHVELNKAKVDSTEEVTLDTTNPMVLIDTLLDTITEIDSTTGSGSITKVTGTAIYRNTSNSSTYKQGEGTITWTGTITPIAGYTIPDEEIAPTSMSTPSSTPTPTNAKLPTLLKSIRDNIKDNDAHNNRDTTYIGHNKVDTVTVSVDDKGKLVVVVKLGMITRNLVPNDLGDAKLLDADEEDMELDLGTAVTGASTYNPTAFEDFINTTANTGIFTVKNAKATGTLDTYAGIITITADIVLAPGYIVPTGGVNDPTGEEASTLISTILDAITGGASAGASALINTDGTNTALITDAGKLKVEITLKIKPTS
jgi:hypothetical protein